MLNVVADAGYSNGEQAEACESQGIMPHVPANRAVNNQGDGDLFDRSEFHYDEKNDTFRCPANQTLTRKQLQRHKKRVISAGAAEVCGACAMKSRCTNAPQRFVHRHLHDGALQRMQQCMTPEMRLRRSTVEHPFASLKYRIFGHPRFLLRGLQGAQAEISLWDALIVAATKPASCRYLLTEDLQADENLDGVLVINPFIRNPASLSSG